MGGSGQVSYTSRSISASRQLFRSALQEKTKTTSVPPKVRNVFIAFHVADEAQVNLLRAQARNEDFGMNFRDYSVKEPFDEAWKTNCRDRIAQTSLTVCMIGPETASREAVIWELEESYRQGHQVIGVRIYRDRNDPVPEPILRHGSPVIYWDRDELNRYLQH